MISLTINGKTLSVDAEDDAPLLWVIRDEVGLTGTKFGCGIGMCGACTVHVGGQAVRSCMTPLEDVAGRVPDGVTLCDARGVHGSAVAELAVLMILALQRRLPDFLASQSHGAWTPAQSDDLRDKRVVIIGAGDLGEQTARRLRSFDAVPVLVATSARDGVHAITELPELLPEADMVVLTLPLTRRTEGMVDADFLATRFRI